MSWCLFSALNILLIESQSSGSVSGLSYKKEIHKHTTLPPVGQQQ